MSVPRTSDSVRPGPHRQEGTPVTHHHPTRTSADTDANASTGTTDAIGDEQTKRIPRTLTDALDAPPTAVDNPVDSPVDGACVRWKVGGELLLACG